MEKIFEWILEEVFQMVKKEFVSEKGIRKMEELDDVLEEKNMTKEYAMENFDYFYATDYYFYFDEDENLISMDKEDLEHMVEDELEDEIEYPDQLKLIKKAVEKLERDLRK